MKAEDIQLWEPGKPPEGAKIERWSFVHFIQPPKKEWWVIIRKSFWKQKWVFSEIIIESKIGIQG